MEHTIIHKPDFAAVKINLSAGEQVCAEAGAMLAMSSNINLETSTRGGALKGLKRATMGGESFWMNTFTAQDKPGDLYLAPATSGDVLHLVLEGKPLFLQSGSYLASSPSVDLDAKWTGAKTFFGGEGLFMLKCAGTGDLWFSSFGAIHEIDVEGGYTVDTGAIVAFEETLSFRVRSVGGMKSLLFSGEGLVCEFSGHGKLYLQTRLPASFINWIHPFRPKRAKKKEN